MGRLSKEEYREAKGCLKRYNYNCINIINIQRDILHLHSSWHLSLCLIFTYMQRTALHLAHSEEHR